MIDLRPAEECAYDVVALGEVMLRLDPGDRRIRTARSFDVWEGGGEYNVARGLRSVFGHRAGVLTSLVDNEVGRLVENLVLAGGVDTSLVRWVPFDGLGRAARNGLNFTERGFGVRGALGVSDRGATATSLLTPGDLDLEDLFGRRGVRWLHTGGVLAGLSPGTAALAEEAMAVARRHGTVVSYDTNFRPSLWADRGGPDAAVAVNARLAAHVDVLVGHPADVTPPGEGDAPPDRSPDGFADACASLGERLPHLSVVATTHRRVQDASRNDWQGLAWSREDGVVRSRPYADLAVLDRVGGGDGFAAGLVHGLLGGEPLASCVELGAAHGALAVTTPGDTSMATADEVRALAAGGGSAVRR
ncbi:sugar kinase [Nocardioides bruguierae]|uniref:sugar kinase n=1 Tax=Nocardioides bruguierae TaxID=2945102 RepID=UPI00201FD5FA|nr:sugar kinase [Nocardioides bruguierae]MCL8024490.1 sugar kinase [Nocardioides bruguierae]